MAFFPQDLFQTLLSLERKRSERSGHPFALALLEIGCLPDYSPLRKSLTSHLRATDLAGWYHEPCVMGVIFNTLNGAPIQKVRATLHSKVQDMVQGEVPFKLFIFPDDVTRELYPERFEIKRDISFHIMKRVIDVAGSLAAIVLLSPALLAIAALVKLSSPGPALFKQKRLGLFGKEFDCLKFRTMFVGNDSSIHKEYVAKLIQGDLKSSGVYKIKNDPRVTAIGCFLRKFSLDELPQFFNILTGKMSLVGPRPPIQYEMEKYMSWHKRRVLEVKPGLTGLWQVKGRSRTSFDEMVRLDIQYIQEQSGWLDFKIVIQTPLAILSGIGAY